MNGKPTGLVSADARDPRTARDGGAPRPSQHGYRGEAEEAQEQVDLIDEANRIVEAEERQLEDEEDGQAARERVEGGESVHGEDPKDAEVSG